MHGFKCRYLISLTKTYYTINIVITAKCHCVACADTVLVISIRIGTVLASIILTQMKQEDSPLLTQFLIPFVNHGENMNHYKNWREEE